VSYVLVFAAVLVGCVLLGSVLRKVLQVVMLLWLDRLGGGLLGFGKGLILSMLLLMILLFFFPSSSFVQQSKIVPYLHKITKTCILIMPEDIKESIFNK
jgi:membrane protein required for colicin V production